MLLTCAALPPSLNGPNGLLRMHWSKRRKEADRWAMLLLVARGRNRERFNRCAVKITLYRTRLLDVDNSYGCCKVLLDQLVKLEILQDDGPEYVVSLDVQQVKVKRVEVRTVIEITEAM